MPILTDEQIKALEEAAKPLVKWLNDNVNPHHYVIVEPTGAELVSGECRVKIEEYLKD
jgi:hypothetical protein